jgi:protocatechuate 3,4-dioxygenase beta subunit
MLRVVILDPQGQPLAGANVHSSIWTEEKDFKANRDYKTDAAGAAAVELPKTFYILRLWASKKPFVTMFANWERSELASGKEFPAKYTMRLEAGVTAGGRIVDEQGRPVVGAKVQVSLSGDPKPAHSDGRTRYDTWLAFGTDAVTTDVEGRWHIDNVPNHAQADLRLQVGHPDYVSDEQWGQIQKANGVTAAMLRQGTATLTLKRGVIVRGRVTDPSGKPIKDAIVVAGDRPYDSNAPRKFPTDADGNFRLPTLAPGDTSLTVIAAAWAPHYRKVSLRADLPRQDFRMESGKPARLRVVDAAGRPVPKVSVEITGWKGSESLQTIHNPNHPKIPDTGIPNQTNVEGVWEWASAPDDAVKLRVWSKGFAASELEIAGGEPERKITIKSEHRITGRVTDATTGKPIAVFTVIPVDVVRKDFLLEERSNAKAGKDGRLEHLATRTDIPLRVRVEATGYRTQTGPEFRVGDDSPRTQDFALQPSEPITGVIQDGDGKPVAKAEVLLATPTSAARLAEDHGNHKSFTDSTGRFSFPDPGEPFAVVARADGGYAQAEFAAGQHEAGALKLRPWASVRGRFRDGGKAISGATIFLQPIAIDNLERPRIEAMLQVETGADGRFEFPRVRPGAIGVRVYLGPWKDEGYRSGPAVPLELKPGENADLKLGSGGTTLTGKVKLTGKVPTGLDCNYSLNYLIRREPGITPPPEIAKLGFDIRNGWRDEWMRSEEGQAYFATLRSWFVKLAPDGSFRISSVPAGEYDLAVGVYAKPEG